MERRELAWYVLFENLTQGLLLDETLRTAGLHATIVPIPRHLGKGCGAALAVRADELDDVRVLMEHKGMGALEIASAERDVVDLRRDRYC
jgi:hypothetical protein